MNADKVWFITGASQDPALILVQNLLDKGYKVVGTYRSIDTFKKMISGDYCNRFLALQADVNNEVSLSKAIQQTLKAFGKIDVFVNNTGCALSRARDNANEGAIKKFFAADVRAAINITRNIMPLMRKQGFGAVINLSVLTNFSGLPDRTSYSATNEEMIALAEVLASHI